jgi:hypothetical protein
MQPMNEEIVEILEPINNGYRVLRVNISAVPQGYLHVEYKGNMYWMHMSHLKAGEGIVQNRFTGELKRKIIKFAVQLQEVLPRTYKDWEEHLRREPNPETEIEKLFYISNQFTLSSKRLDSLEEKKELIRLLFECSLSTRNKMLKTFKSKHLTQKSARKFIKGYYKSAT